MCSSEVKYHQTSLHLQVLEHVPARVDAATRRVICADPARRGNAGISEQSIQETPSLIFVTLVMVLVPHRSKESARDSYDECHGVAVSLWLATVSAITNLLKKKTPQIPCEKGTTSRARHTQVRTTVDTTRIRRTLDTLSGTVTLHHFSSPSFPLFFFPSVAAACSQTIGDKALHGHSSPPAKRPHATSAYPFSVCARTSLLPANANHLLTLFTSLGSHLFLLVCTATLLWATLL